MSSQASPRGQFRGRGNHFRSRGRGRGRGSHFGHENNPNVPSYNQIPPGTLVSIVLKEDQPTGRQVQGIVGEILTGGNHPRGIKVRLRDGRVGRVQKLCSEEDRKAGEGGMSGLGRNGEVLTNLEGGFGQPGAEQHSAGNILQTTNQRPAPLPKYQDSRYDGYDAPQREEANLEDYVVFKTKGKGKKGKKKTIEPDVDAEGLSGTSSATIISTCPVCGEFEGDEAAVAHHVEGHFE
jgi:uncharacterized repeat protein (TIGR03833 family)